MNGLRCNFEMLPVQNLILKKIIVNQLSAVLPVPFLNWCTGRIPRLIRIHFEACSAPFLYFVII